MNWTKITTPDTLPPKFHGPLSRHVQVFVANMQTVACYDYNFNEWDLAYGVSANDDVKLNPTHWKPLEANPTT